MCIRDSINALLHRRVVLTRTLLTSRLPYFFDPQPYHIEMAFKWQSTIHSLNHSYPSFSIAVTRRYSMSTPSRSFPGFTATTSHETNRKRQRSTLPPSPNCSSASRTSAVTMNWRTAWSPLRQSELEQLPLSWIAETSEIEWKCGRHRKPPGC